MNARFFLLVQHCLPKRLISTLVGWLTRLELGPLTHLAIALFTRVYGVNLSEAELTRSADYPSFNAFFTRALKAGARPLPSRPERIVSPADGIVSALGVLEAGSIIQAKGIDYDLTDLFGGDAPLATRFVGGGFATIYLAPHNYHRVHAPLAGTARFLRYLPGTLYSVNDATTRHLPRLFCRNERVVTVLETHGGWYALVMVGALNVGSIELALRTRRRNRPQADLMPYVTQALDGPDFARGDEFGRFNMGSTVILLTSPGLAAWDEDWLPGRASRVGAAMGALLPGAAAAS